MTKVRTDQRSNLELVGDGFANNRPYLSKCNFREVDIKRCNTAYEIALLLVSKGPVCNGSGASRSIEKLDKEEINIRVSSMT